MGIDYRFETQRKVDNLGRIIIPSNYLNFLKINIGNKIISYIDKNGNLVLKKEKQKCIFCDSEISLSKISDIHVCPKCYTLNNRKLIVNNRYSITIIQEAYRCLIHKKLRETLNISSNDYVSIGLIEDKLVIKKSKQFSLLTNQINIG
ncbi:MAG: abrB 4 [Clostridiaceae bacterium]|jgi:transcriptional pleiotropic regulator of transition state genes|nr:abrB 4 [Clostridiaceae bacterium]